MPLKPLALVSPIPPMEARPVATLPSGDGWQYEPKWDGFRCIAFRDGDDVELQSKSGKPLTRYFPEAVAAFRSLASERFVVDGELVIVSGGASDFDALLQRIHPAASRVKRLAQEMPATFVAFDLLVNEKNVSLTGQPLEQRRAALEAFAERNFDGEHIQLSPVSRERSQAQQWLDSGTHLFDGVVAKRLAAPYDSSGRDAAVKIKHAYTADCVVGGYRTTASGNAVASLLLGLYDGQTLDQVGFVSGLDAQMRKEAFRKLAPLARDESFTGVMPGGPSRWRSGTPEWQPVTPQLVVEVAFDRVTGRRFRHGARFIRWRADKAPRQCTIEQLLQPRRSQRC
ncbi:MAG: ATP-dependent DNA ligase [Vulcanimicrobiaceae bacterium]